MPHTERVRQLVLALIGTDLSPYKERVVSRGLRLRAVETGLGDSERYLCALEVGDEWARAEAKRLAAGLCPQVSGFFRDPPVFEALEELVYPVVVRRTSQARVRIWSAACSRGQEAYSLAVSFRRWARDHGYEGRFAVLGTDLSDEALAAARAGVYTAREIEGAPPWVLDEAFMALPGKKFGLRREIRDLVKFQRRDAIDVRSNPVGFDLISCRNLMIYLRRPVQEAVLLSLRRSLLPGGFLLLGTSETVLGQPWKVFEHVSPRWRIYRNPDPS
jgi:chemotaxis methyl-accepting protein methylase